MAGRSFCQQFSLPSSIPLTKRTDSRDYYSTGPQHNARLEIVKRLRLANCLPSSTPHRSDKFIRFNMANFQFVHGSGTSPAPVPHTTLDRPWQSMDHDTLFLRIYLSIDRWSHHRADLPVATGRRAIPQQMLGVHALVSSLVVI